MGTNRFVMMAGHRCPYLVTKSYIWNSLVFFFLFLVTFFVCFCFSHSHERSLFSTYFLQAGISLYCRKLYTPGRHELAPVFVNGKMTLVQWPRFPWRERENIEVGTDVCRVSASCQPHAESLAGLSNLNGPAALAVSGALFVSQN